MKKTVITRIALALSALLVATTAGALQFGAPAAPTNCAAVLSISRGGSITEVTWRDNSNNEDGFIVERWVQNGGWSFSESLSTGPNQTIAQFYGSFQPATAKYRVRAFNASGFSRWSKWSNPTH